MKRIIALIVGFFVAVVACAFALPTTTVFANESEELVVHFIDVGQGDACIVELPDDRTILVDAGENKNAVKTKLDEYITQNIKDDEGNVIEYFDYAILTHSDSDHIGSMAYVLEQYPAKVVYRPNEECAYASCEGDPANNGENVRNCFWGDEHGTKSTKTYHTALQAAYSVADEVIVTNPYDSTQNIITSTSADEYEINFYSPLSPNYSDHNNYSPVIVIQYQGKEIVISGDAEAQNEAEFVAAAQGGEGRYSIFSDFSADVIKLGHHGSRTSSSEEYLNVMTKSSLRDGIFVVISCGEGNSYGHPHPEVLTRLDDLGFSQDNILRTDLLGDIVISVAEIEGVYQVVYGDRTGGSGDSGSGSGGGSGSGSGGNSGGGSENDGGSSGSESDGGESEGELDIFAIFNELTPMQKTLVIIVVIVVVAIAIILCAKSNKKKGKGRGKRR